jgi:uncharacterized protein with WD repeat
MVLLVQTDKGHSLLQLKNAKLSTYVDSKSEPIIDSMSKANVVKVEVSKSGKKICIISNKIAVFDSTNGEKVFDGSFEFSTSEVFSQCWFSSQETKIVLLTRKSDSYGLHVFSLVKAPSTLATFVLKSYTASNSSNASLPISWSDDEKIAIVNLGVVIKVYDGDFVQELSSIPGQGVKTVKLGPGPAPYPLVTFTGKSSKHPATLALYELPVISNGKPVLARTLEVDEAFIVFSPNGAYALASLSNSTSDSNYYGDVKLFLIDRKKAIIKPVLGLKDGPTHDFAWAHDSSSFSVVAGLSPPVATLHEANGTPVYTFGSSGWNYVSYNHLGWLLLGGFGNMNGLFDVFDVKSRARISVTFSISLVTEVQWSKNGKFLLFLTTKPRIKIDNGLTIVKYTGETIANEKFADLFHARSVYLSERDNLDDDSILTEPPAVVKAKAAAAAKPAAYRPPGSSGSVAALMNADKVSASAIRPGATATSKPVPGAPVASLPVGATLSASQKKRLKAKAKAAAAAGAASKDDEDDE